MTLLRQQFETETNWMRDRLDLLGEKSLSQIVILLVLIRLECT